MSSDEIRIDRFEETGSAFFTIVSPDARNHAMSFEIRHWEFRVAAADPTADKPAQLAGYAAVFGSPSQDLGGFTEVIAPGAFRESLAGQVDIRALVNHDPDKLMGRTSSGTLRVSEDGQGLRIENDIPDTTYARDLLSLVKRGDVKGMSFGFRVPKGGDSWSTRDGVKLRTLNKIDLAEVTYTDNPAYLGTSVDSRSLAKVDPAAIEAAKNFQEFPGLVKRRRELLTILAMNA